MIALEKEIIALKDMMTHEFWRPAPAPRPSSQVAPSEKSKVSQLTPPPELNEKARTHTSTSQTFLGNELEEDRVEEAVRYRREDDINTKAEQWIRGLRGDKLKPMAKAMGRVVAASIYHGEPQSYCIHGLEGIHLFDSPNV